MIFDTMPEDFDPKKHVMPCAQCGTNENKHLMKDVTPKEWKGIYELFRCSDCGREVQVKYG